MSESVLYEQDQWMIRLRSVFFLPFCLICFRDQIFRNRDFFRHQIFRKRDFFEVNFPKSKLRLFSEIEFSETKTFSKTKFPKQKPRPQKVGKSLETKKSHSYCGHRNQFWATEVEIKETNKLKVMNELWPWTAMWISYNVLYPRSQFKGDVDGYWIPPKLSPQNLMFHGFTLRCISHI